MSKLVRLKPHAPKRGHFLRQYTYGPTRTKFEEKRGWYKVDDVVATYLKTVKQRESDPMSPLAFDVCTPAEAAAIDRAERRKDNERRTAAEASREPVDMTSSSVQKRFARPAPVETATQEEIDDVGGDEEPIEPEDGADETKVVGSGEDEGVGGDEDGEDPFEMPDDLPESPAPEAAKAAPKPAAGIKSGKKPKPARAPRAMVAAKE